MVINENIENNQKGNNNYEQIKNRTKNFSRIHGINAK